MKRPVSITNDDLRKAWRECALINMTFEKALIHPAISVAITRLAESNVRRQMRLAELQKHDHKRAQANDYNDYSD